MPLTHIARGIIAEDIARADKIQISDCPVFDEKLAYFFYGRPAYRMPIDGVVKLEAACPYCFIFNSKIMDEAKAIFAFDTGAFKKRLYKHILIEEMRIEDYSLGNKKERPNKLISAVFGDKETYFMGDTTRVSIGAGSSKPWDFHVRSYLHLLTSPGRNEPDDRICSIEVILDKEVPLEGGLEAVVVPHTLWDEQAKAPWLAKLHERKVEIAPYLFVPGRHPEHYHALMEIEVKNLYKRRSIL